MSHWIAISSEQFTPADQGLKGLSAMQVDNTSSGFGILLRDLGGPFEDIKALPILSGVFSKSGIKKLDDFMMEQGFRTKYRHTFKRSGDAPNGTPKRDIYLVRAYEYPLSWEDISEEERLEKLVKIRLELKKLGSPEQDMLVFSFWPDTILIKEIGDPILLARHLGLDRHQLSAKLLMLHSGHDHYAPAHPYSCSPFFLKGFSTMSSGENTTCVSTKSFLNGCQYHGYETCTSNSDAFTHVLHYTINELKFGIEAYKHILTPLEENLITSHPDATFLRHLKQTCRQMIIDGPNCIIGCLPDNTLFMLQDRSKRCPGIIGGGPGFYVFASDPCGLDAILPERDREKDTQPMHLNTAVVRQGHAPLEMLQQTDPLLSN